MEWKRDWGLTARVWFTGLLLFLLYLVFMTILLVLFPSVSILVHCHPGGGHGTGPVLLLRQDGTLVNRRPRH